ncbi:hypothetical protein HY605_01180 [Candidatus Peregrinibacteria bacterium]|nr:hypothetical protein [Candidatus Peregrinibacteria bacterium]
MPVMRALTAARNILLSGLVYNEDQVTIEPLTYREGDVQTARVFVKFNKPPNPEHIKSLVDLEPKINTYIDVTEDGKLRLRYEMIQVDN